MAKVKNKVGKIIIEPGVGNILPWEMHSALALKDAGYIVRFVPKHDSVCTADAYLNNTLFEFKSPEGARIKSVENNLQKALRRQSKNVVIDSCRIKNLKDKNIEKYLISRLKQKKGIGMLIFITKNGEVIDINDRLC